MKFICLNLKLILGGDFGNREDKINELLRKMV